MGCVQINPILVELDGVKLSREISNSEILARWRRIKAWPSAAILLAGECNLSPNPLRASLWSLQPLICQFIGKSDNRRPSATLDLVDVGLCALSKPYRRMNI
jgi:hypothetical protein